jgi:deoxyribose-phosphate aldolase
MNRKQIFAGVAALALVLGAAGPAFAATTSGTSTVSATVDSSISMTVPATISLGHGVAGGVLTSSDFSVTVTASDPFTVTASTTDFHGNGHSIDAGHLAYTVGGTDISAVSAGTIVTLGTVTPLTMHLKLALPATQQSDSYVATITWSAAD